MSWASHPTNEMPATSPDPSGRQRKRRAGVVGICAAVVLVVLAVLAAVFAPTLFGGRPPSNAAGNGTAGSADPFGGDPGTPSLELASPSGQSSAAASTTATAKVTTPPPTANAPGTSSLEDEVVRLTNAERTKHGCTALRTDSRLQTAARNHSAEMAMILQLTHDSVSGGNPGARMQQAGYNTTGGWAENVAAAYPTPDAVMAGWMNSEGHRNNILNCSLKAIGVGVVRADNGQLYWTQDFGGR